MPTPRKYGPKKPWRQKRPGVGGPDTKCSPETIKKIADAIAVGNYIEVASAMGGISKRTYHDWKAKGEEGIEPYTDFLAAIIEAEAEAEYRALTHIQLAADRGIWQAAAWYLERKHPERWARRDGVPQSSNESVKDKPLSETLADDATLDALSEALGLGDATP